MSTFYKYTNFKYSAVAIGQNPLGYGGQAKYTREEILENILEIIDEFVDKKLLIIIVCKDVFNAETIVGCFF